MSDDVKNKIQKVLPIFAFDTETELISYENPVPDLICMSYADTGALQGSIVTPWEHTIENQIKLVITKNQHMVGHNTAFDLSILAFKYPDLLPFIFSALDNNLIHDTLLREKLLNLTLHGNFDVIEVNGCSLRLGYKQVDLEKKYLNLDRSDLKEAEDAPRMNYAMYKNVPLEKWDEKFITYSIDDSVNCGLIFQAQEQARAKCIEMTGYDPFKVETFRVKVSFALRLLECVGSRMDTAKIVEVAEKFRTEYNQPRLRNPLIKAGLLIDAIPAMPYAKSPLAHTDLCNARKDNVEQKKLRKARACGCPLKMKKAVKEKMPTKVLHKYIWNLAHKNPEIKAWPSEGCASELRKAGIYKTVIKEGAFTSEILSMQIDGSTGNAILPEGIKLQTNEVWASTFAALDPLLSIWAERKALRKIITDYLPKMFYKNDKGIEQPAEIIRGSFYPLCLTGRSSSSASKFYPSRNEQNVDPRVRPCTIPREGNILVSTDFSGMELGTLAQKCINLFGSSVMANNINKGIDNHAYLAAQIAVNIDVDFAKYVRNAKISFNDMYKVYDIFSLFKDLNEKCDSVDFCANFKAKYRQEESKELDRPVLWADFYDYYRTLAKPTGLGFPGGLGAATMVAFAKGGYKVNLSLELAQKLREVWLETYPEMGLYLDWIKKQCKDPNHAPIQYEDDDGKTKTQTYFAYDTPRGMHRSKCGFCEAANGAALQAFSAEGALESLYRFQKATWLADENDLLYGSFAINFLHDEILWETPGDKYVDGKVVKATERIMSDAMMELTPNVQARADSVAMRRWYKKAKPIWDGGYLIPWEPEKKRSI